MKIFKKISAIAASALMVGMTMGVAAAANYPSPFVTGGNADVAIIYGTGTGVSSLDLVQAGNLQTNLQSYLSGGSSGTGTSTSGEAVSLYTGGTKIYISDGLNKVRSTLTKADLPTILADSSFSGNVDATITQSIVLGIPSGNVNNITFGKQPTSDDEPNLALSLGTSGQTQPAYNLTATFSKVVNFTHADSEGEQVNFFGKDYTVASATDATNLVLLQSAEKLSLTSDAPTVDVTIGGKTYTVELVSASDTAATLKVTDASGASETKEVSEAASKKINGVTIAVQTADETNLKLSATIIAGSEKITFTQGSNVKIGESDTAIQGTYVDFAGGNPGALSKLVVGIAAVDSDHDAVKAGGELLDPIFGTVKLALSGFNIAQDSAAREDIKVYPSGDSRLAVSFTDYLGNTKEQRYAYYGSGGSNASLYVDDNHANMSVKEMEKMHRNDVIVLGNEDDGHILKVSNPYRGTSGGTTASGDLLSFIDQRTGETVTATLTANTSTVSTGTLQIGGKQYTVYLEGTPLMSQDSYNVSLDYPDSSGNNVILFPTIRTSKGAQLAFYELENISVVNWQNGSNQGLTNLSGIMVPNGADAYQTIGFALNNGTGLADSSINVTCGTTTTAVKDDSAGSVTCAITNTGFTYNITYNEALGIVTVGLQNVANTAVNAEPALMLFEEKDSANVYNGLIVTTESGASSDDGIGVNDVERTWTQDGLWDSIPEVANNKLLQEVDKFGTFVTTDTGDSDQARATISYPDEQVYALLYMGEETSSIGVVGGVSGAQLGEVLAMDTEVSSVSTHNLVVVGGSCINSVAANLVGGAYCGSAWTTATGVGSGQFLIQSFADKYTAGKVALLVAGYDAADTVNAATYLRTKSVDTASGKKYLGTSATSATLVTATA